MSTGLLDRTRQVASLARHCILDLWRLEGIFEDRPLSILVADEGSTLSYIRTLAFPDGCVSHKVGRIPAIHAPSLSERKEGLVVVGANTLLLDRFRECGFDLVPKWLPLYLPVCEHPDEIICGLSYKARNDIRRMLRHLEKTGYVFELTNNTKWLDMFYHRMYKPYALQRYGEKAIIRSHKAIRKAFLSGAGISVMLGEEWVAGEVIYRDGSTLYSGWMGLLNGNEELVKQGVSQGLYYHDLLTAYNWGCTGVNFGRSRPFSSDGVLRYKLKWGMQAVSEHPGTGVFAIMAPDPTDQTLKFLAKHRYFRLTGAGLEMTDYA